MRAADLHRLARLLREIALRATENTGQESVNAGELAVLEDIARHPGSTIRDITVRTGLAQSLVSRVTRAMADNDALTITSDQSDRRKVRIDVAPATRRIILRRAANTITEAIAACTPGLTVAERESLEHHLAEAHDLLIRGSSAPEDRP
jgi:DNA-binding MarR family transcriptional regulator